MEMHQVRYFLAVAEHLNFTRAADRLHVTQPSLTRAVQKLEEELGGPLFHRERANTHLTELGRIMLPHLQATLGAALEAKKQAISFRKREVGQLALGACSTVAADIGVSLLQTVSALIGALDIVVEVAGTATIEIRLMSGDIDAGLFGLLHAPGATNDVDRFDVRPLCASGFVVAFPPGHRFALAGDVLLEHLDAEPLIVASGVEYETIIAAAMEARGLQRLVRHIGDERWHEDLVRAGLGCAIWPEAMALARRLPFKRLTDLPLTQHVVLTTVAGRRHSPALAALIQAADRLAKTAVLAEAS